MKPNAVIFRLDDEQLCIVVRKDGKFDWDKILYANKELSDAYADLPSNPFTFVFCFFETTKLTCEQRKTVIPDQTFYSLHSADMLKGTIELDYAKQYENGVTIPASVDPSFIGGINAFLTGTNYNDNPHAIGSFERAIWSNGYGWCEYAKVTKENVIEKIQTIKDWNNVCNDPI